MLNNHSRGLSFFLEFFLQKSVFLYEMFVLLLYRFLCLL